MNTVPRRAMNLSRCWKKRWKSAISRQGSIQMKIGMKWLAIGGLAVSGIALLAQPPAGGRGGSGFGALGGSGRGRGGGGGFGGAGFVPNPTFDKDPPVLPADLKPGGVLIYSKTNGFREEAG